MISCRRMCELLKRAEQAVAGKHAAERSGVREIDAESPEEFDREVERILREEPPAPGFGYLLVPKQLTMEEWLTEHPPAKPIQDQE